MSYLGNGNLQRKRARLGVRLAEEGEASLLFVWRESDERVVRGLMVWAALERKLARPLLTFRGRRVVGEQAVITATIPGRENGNGR